MTSSRRKKAADQARWVLPDRWCTLITHCLGGRHLSDKWEARCCLNLWRSRRLGQALWQQQQETKKTELQLQLGKDVNNLRVPDMWQARRLFQITLSVYFLELYLETIASWPHPYFGMPFSICLAPLRSAEIEHWKHRYRSIKSQITFAVRSENRPRQSACSLKSL